MAALDNSKPLLKSLTMPKSVDLSGGSKAVSITVGATDQGLGVDFVAFTFDKSYQSSYGRSSSFSFYDSQDSFSDGVSSSSQIFTKDTASGTYTISGLSVYDKAGNYTYYTTADLVAAGLQTTIDVTGGAPAADTVKPRLTSLTMPKSLDLSGGSKAVSITVGATDQGLGVDFVAFSFDNIYQSSYGRSSSFSFYDSQDSFSDGVSSSSQIFTKDTASGTYTISGLSVYDKAGNYTYYTTADLVAAGFQTTIDVTGVSVADTFKPRLTSLKMPKSVDLSGGSKAVSVTVGATDQGLGVDFVAFTFDKSYQSSYGRSSSFSFYDSQDSFSDGVSSSSQIFTKDTASGTYTISGLSVYDKAGNYTYYTTADLVAAGFQTTIDVTDAPGGSLSLIGTALGDAIVGGPGDDLISGRDGDDTISGGDGRDTLFGDAGADLILGGAGNDELRGYIGNDTLFGDDGDDRIYGEQGDDFIGAGAGNDLVFGGDGADALIGEGGNDTLFGEAGNDILDGRDGDDFIGAGAGDDRLFGGAGNDALVGNSGTIPCSENSETTGSKDVKAPTSWAVVRATTASLAAPITTISMARTATTCCSAMPATMG